MAPDWRIVVREESLDRLTDHATVPTAFVVDRVLTVSVPANGLGGIVLTEADVDAPWEKDYDAIDDEGPTSWAKRFDTRNWALMAAHDGVARVGGAVVAFRTPGLTMLEERADLAVLWDLRVDPRFRGRGVATALFRAVEDWARDRRCRMLKVETQNINVPACRFYARMGCTLAAINRFAYPRLPEETALMWMKDLPGSTAHG